MRTQNRSGCCSQCCKAVVISSGLCRTCELWVNRTMLFVISIPQDRPASTKVTRSSPREKRSAQAPAQQARNRSQCPIQRLKTYEVRRDEAKTRKNRHGNRRAQFVDTGSHKRQTHLAFSMEATRRCPLSALPGESRPQLIPESGASCRVPSCEEDRSRLVLSIRPAVKLS